MKSAARVPEEFVEFDPEASEAFDGAPYVARVPSALRIRTLVWGALERHLEGKPEAADFVKPSFAWRPRREYLRLQLAAARDPEGRVTAQALYRIAGRVYPDFAVTTLGRAMFAVAGRDFNRMCSAAHRAYDSVSSHGELILRENRPGRVHVAVIGIWDLPPFTAGVFRGAMEVAGLTPRSVYLRSRSLDWHEVILDW